MHDKRFSRRNSTLLLLAIAVLVGVACNMPGIAAPTVELFPTETEIPLNTPGTGGQIDQPDPSGPTPTPPPTVTVASGQARCQASGVAAAPGQVIVFVYFHCDNQLAFVPRLVQQGQRDALANAAMQALLTGPSASEQAAGYTSWFSSQTAGTLRSLTLAPNGQVVVDMNDFSAAIPNASSSAGSRVLIDQISFTLFQFPDYQSILMTFEGDCNRFWNWLQSGCSEIMRAR